MSTTCNQEQPLGLLCIGNIYCHRMSTSLTMCGVYIYLIPFARFKTGTSTHLSSVWRGWEKNKTKKIQNPPLPRSENRMRGPSRARTDEKRISSERISALDFGIIYRPKMWFTEAGEIVEMFRSSFPLSFLFFVPIFILISPVSPVYAAQEFNVYRMQQFDLQGSSYGKFLFSLKQNFQKPCALITCV